MRDAYPLEPSADEMRRLIDEAARRVINHIESLPSQPAQNVEGATDFARTLIEPLPQRGTSYDALLDFLFDEAIPRHWTPSSRPHQLYQSPRRVGRRSPGSLSAIAMPVLSRVRLLCGRWRLRCQALVVSLLPALRGDHAPTHLPTHFATTFRSRPRIDSPHGRSEPVVGAESWREPVIR